MSTRHPQGIGVGVTGLGVYLPATVRHNADWPQRFHDTHAARVKTDLTTAVEHAVALARGRTIEAGDLPSFAPLGQRRAPRPLRAPSPSPRELGLIETSVDMSLAEVERLHVAKPVVADDPKSANYRRRPNRRACTDLC